MASHLRVVRPYWFRISGVLISLMLRVRRCWMSVKTFGRYMKIPDETRVRTQL